MNYCIVRCVLKEGSGERTSVNVQIWRQYGAQGLVKTKYTSSRYSTNEKRGRIMLTVKSAFQMEQSDIQMTPQRGGKGEEKKA